MICADCILAYTDPNDDEDVYNCPFSFQGAFHSNEKCHYPKMYNGMIRELRLQLNLYKHTRTALMETLDEN